MDVEREVRRSLSRQQIAIESNAYHAIARLNWMHAIGSGICGCGADIEGHAVWDNHSAIETPRDKDYYA